MSNLSIASRNLSDIKNTIFASLAILCIALLSPLTGSDKTYITVDFLLLFTTCSALYYSSIFLVGLKFKKWKKLNISKQKFVAVFLIIAITTIAFKGIDRLILRPPANLLSIESYRSSREIGSNFFSVIAAMLSPFIVLAYSSISTEIKKNKKSWVFSILVLAIVISDTLLSGSRGILLLMLTSLLFNKIKRWHLPWLAIGLMLAFGIQFIYRFSQLQGIDAQNISSTLEALSQTGYAYFVPATEYALSLIALPIIGDGVFALIQANQYLAHGIYEFAYIYATHTDLAFSPSQLVPHFGKILGGGSLAERENLYYTLHGSSYLAFGIASVPFSIILGSFIGLMYRRAQHVSKNATAVINLSIFLTPFVNSIGGYDFPFFMLSIFLLSNIKLR